MFQPNLSSPVPVTGTPNTSSYAKNMSPGISLKLPEEPERQANYGPKHAFRMPLLLSG